LGYGEFGGDSVQPLGANGCTGKVVEGVKLFWLQHWP
jgi:hypothetical protein